MLKKLRRIKSNKIKINEIYLLNSNSAFYIECKVSERESIILGANYDSLVIGLELAIPDNASSFKFYKLPESIQRLWKEE